LRMADEWFERTCELVKKTGESRDLLEELLLAYYVTNDQNKKTRIRETVERLISMTVTEESFLSEKPVLECPSPREIAGDISLGTILYGETLLYPFGLSKEELMRGMLIAGCAGTGKTNASLKVVNELLAIDIPFLVFDWKRNYRDLIPSAGKKILVFTVGRELCPFHFNPLIPPKGTSPSVWLSKIIEIISHAYFLGEGVIYILTRALDAIYRQFGVYDGSNNWPTFRHVHDYLRGYKSTGRETQWLASANRAVVALCFGETDRILNVTHYAVEELLEQNVILELDALTESSKVFLTEALLLWIHHYRMAEGKREQLKHVCIVEEAHHILSRKLQYVSGTETVIDIILREIRELGEAMIIIDQNPSLLSIPALGNTYTTLCLNLKEPHDVNTMCNVLNLECEQKDYLTKLEVGEAIVKLQGRYTEPFLVKIPKVEIAKGSMTDPLVKESMQDFYAELGEIRANSPQTVTIRAILNGSKEDEKTTKNNKNQENEKIELTELEKEFLEDILKNDISRVTERYKRLGINEYQGNKVQKQLKEKQMIQEAKLLDLQGRYWGKALELSEKGRRLLGAVEETKRRGSIVHRHYVKLVAELLRKQGYRVEEEYALGEGKTADIVVERKLAIEVQRDDRNALENLEKNLKAGLEVVLACESQSLRKQIETALAKQGLEGKARVVLLSELTALPNLTNALGHTQGDFS